MKLTIYFDGSFWCGLVEVEDNGHYQAIRHVFGPEPKDADVWEFVTKRLPHLLKQTGVVATQKKTAEKETQSQTDATFDQSRKAAARCFNQSPDCDE